MVSHRILLLYIYSNPFRGGIFILYDFNRGAIRGIKFAKGLAGYGGIGEIFKSRSLQNHLFQIDALDQRLTLKPFAGGDRTVLHDQRKRLVLG